jgi:hypothetical protein
MRAKGKPGTGGASDKNRQGVLKGEMMELNNNESEINKEMVAVEDLIIAVKRDGEGKISTLINTGNRQELEVSLMRLTHQCYGIFNAMSFADQQAAGKGRIIKPGGNGGIMKFVRRGKK